MINQSVTRLTKKIIIGGLSVVMIFLLNGCSRKINFLTSTVVPAARGTVKIKKDKNNNYRIHLDLYNLAEVNRLQPARHAYIVWVTLEQGQAKNMGQINSTSGTFSKQLKASFETVTTLMPLEIYITAEDDINTTFPGNQVVMTTGTF